MGGMPQVWFRGSAAEELSMSVVIHMRKYTDVTIAGRRVATALCCRDALLPSTADSTQVTCSDCQELMAQDVEATLDDFDDMRVRGKDLDALAAQLGVTRKSSVPSYHHVIGADGCMTHQIHQVSGREPDDDLRRRVMELVARPL